MPFALIRRLLVLLPLLCLSACSIYSSPGSQPPHGPDSCVRGNDNKAIHIR